MLTQTRNSLHACGFISFKYEFSNDWKVRDVVGEWILVQNNITMIFHSAKLARRVEARRGELDRLLLLFVLSSLFSHL
jgi:hypothetical protein